MRGATLSIALLTVSGLVSASLSTLVESSHELVTKLEIRGKSELGDLPDFLKEYLRESQRLEFQVSTGPFRQTTLNSEDSHLTKKVASSIRPDGSEDSNFRLERTQSVKLPGVTSEMASEPQEHKRTKLDVALGVGALTVVVSSSVGAAMGINKHFEHQRQREGVRVRNADALH